LTPFLHSIRGIFEAHLENGEFFLDLCGSVILGCQFTQEVKILSKILVRDFSATTNSIRLIFGFAEAHRELHLPANFHLPECHGKNITDGGISEFPTPFS
jgi:hypothetical protein